VVKIATETLVLRETISKLKRGLDEGGDFGNYWGMTLLLLIIIYYLRPSTSLLLESNLYSNLAKVEGKEI
jgi:hypothetical protein